MNTFSKKLITLRTSKGLTQEELANQINVSRQTISKWERGEVTPDSYHLKQLSTLFNVSIDELLGHEQINQSFNLNDFIFNKKIHGHYFKNLLYKAKHISNKQEAITFRQKMLKIGGILLGAGILSIIISFIFFFKNFGSVSFNKSDIIFNFIFFGIGALSTTIGSYFIYIGLAVVIAGYSTNFLDDRKKCPVCKDEVDENEKYCNNCGYHLEKDELNRCECGSIVDQEDNFCKSCGKKIIKSA